MATDLKTIDFNPGQNGLRDPDGLLNSSRIRFYGGPNRFEGGSIVSQPDYGFINRKSGDLEMSHGVDTIYGFGQRVGITNLGKLDMEGNRDDLLGIGMGSNPNRKGLVNQGQINMGRGQDSINGSGGFIGLQNARGATIKMQSGNDSLTGQGSYLVGGSGPSLDRYVGVYNAGRIDMGSGNDTIIGHGSVGMDFAGGGRISLGSGEDEIYGFGYQFIDGGRGFDIAYLDGNSIVGNPYTGIESFNISVSLGSRSDTILITPKLDGEAITMTFRRVEQFQFRDQSLSFDDLVSMANQPGVL